MNWAFILQLMVAGLVLFIVSYQLLLVSFDKLQWCGYDNETEFLLHTNGTCILHAVSFR